MSRSPVVVIGAGIVGLATAHALASGPHPRSVVVVEKEDRLAAHQTGHNSGVIHSGIYYRPGSLKAETCREGRAALMALCEAEGIPFELCGKVIVATSEEERPRLHALHERGQAGGVSCQLIGPGRLAELEPHAAGVEALHVPGAGIVDYGAVCAALARRVAEAGGRVMLGARVVGIHPREGGAVVETTAGEVRGAAVVNCGGLHSDRLAALTGDGGDRPRIVPFRGEYYELLGDARRLCRDLIYPVPDPRFPFLGVHFTRGVGGGVECGPNAVLALAREGYTWGDVVLRDVIDTVSHPGFRKLAARHWRMGLGEMWRSVSKGAFVAALQRLIPEVRAEDLAPAPAGVRAQAVDLDGSLLDDFALERVGRVVHVVNAPSPAATASLAIGARVAALVEG